MTNIILHLVQLAIPVVLCLYIGKWLVVTVARFWSGQGASQPQVNQIQPKVTVKSDEQFLFRYGGARRLDRTNASSWVFRDM